MTASAAEGIDELIRAGVELAAAGISPGSSGNLSVRAGGTILMTGTGTSVGSLRPDDIAVLTPDGSRIAGPKPSKEVGMHLAMYGRDHTFGAVVHVHAHNAVALSCLPPWAANSAVPPITPYFIMRVGQTPLIPYRHPGHPDLRRLIAGQTLSFRAVLLANHGLVAAGSSVDEAVATAIELEQACAVTLATLGHDPVLLAGQEILELTHRYGTSWDLRTPTGARTPTGPTADSSTLRDGHPLPIHAHD